MTRVAATAAALGLLVIAAAACSPELAVEARRAPVVGGEPAAEGDYPATLALIVDGQLSCTGTLIAPTVVLTAAHCLATFDGSVPGVSFALDASAVPPGEVLAGAEMYPHPDFTFDVEMVAGLAQFYDVGLVVLAAPIEGVTPEIVATPAEAAELLEVGATVELVGYGASNADGSGAGLKRTGTGTLREVGETEILISETGEQQNCFGDSGGPGFIALPGGGRRLVGVVSRGPDPANFTCDVGGIDTRADAYLAWIETTLAGHDAGPATGPDAAPVGPDAGTGPGFDADGDDEGGCGGCGAAPGSGAATGWLVLALGLRSVRRRRRP